MARLHLNELDTHREIDAQDVNLWSIITEDNHLLLEIDLNRQIGWTESNNRRIVSCIRQRLRSRGEKTVEVLQDFYMTLQLWRIRTCIHCGGPFQENEIPTHDEEIHDMCWSAYLKAHPELLETEPIDD